MRTKASGYHHTPASARAAGPEIGIDQRLFNLAHQCVSIADRLKAFSYPVDIIRDLALVVKLLARVRRRILEERQGKGRTGTIDAPEGL